jgi:DNA primase
VFAIEIAGEKDPADLILEDPAKWTDAISHARHVVEFFLSVLEKKSSDKRAFRLSVEKNVLPMIAHIKSRIDRDHFIGITASILDISREAVAEEVANAERNVEISFSPEKNEPLPIKRASTSRRETLERKLHGIIFWQEASPEPLFSPSDLRSKYEEIAREKRIIIQDEEKNALIFEAEAFFGGSSALEKHITELLRDVEKEFIKEELLEAEGELRRAEMLHDSAKADEIRLRFNSILKKFNALQSGL